MVVVISRFEDASHGVGSLHQVEGNMDQLMYRKIVRHVMLPFEKENMPRGKKDTVNVEKRVSKPILVVVLFT
jgi:hypothetical protein